MAWRKQEKQPAGTHVHGESHLRELSVDTAKRRDGMECGCWSREAA